MKYGAGVIGKDALSEISFIYHKNIPPVQLLPHSTHDGAE